jgi:putative transposase
MSGYLAHSNGKTPSPRQLEDQYLIVYIKAAHARGRGIYGALKIQTELAAQGLFVGLNRIKCLIKFGSLILLIFLLVRAGCI